MCKLNKEINQQKIYSQFKSFIFLQVTKSMNNLNHEDLLVTLIFFNKDNQRLLSSDPVQGYFAPLASLNYFTSIYTNELFYTKCAKFFRSEL